MKFLKYEINMGKRALWKCAVVLNQPLIYTSYEHQFAEVGQGKSTKKKWTRGSIKSSIGTKDTTDNTH